MKKQLVMGNEAIAYGAMRAGVNVVVGYPGTPSTEVLETIAAHNDGEIYVEWSVNEKVALEVGAGAAYTGARVLVTMKQVGLNVASDPLMSLAYIGVKGGMVVMVADDPGPISSQTEQDTRSFAQYAHVPVFDPSTPEEAYVLIQEAFQISEKYGIPVIFRPTTRICHACSTIAIEERSEKHLVDGFVKDSKWVIFPRLSYQNHLKLVSYEETIGAEFAAFKANLIEGTGAKGILTGGVSYAYVKEAMGELKADTKVMKVTTPYPVPEQKLREFLEGLDEVLVVEELDPFLERTITEICGKYNLKVKIRGKRDGALPVAGEYSFGMVREAIATYLGCLVEGIKGANVDVPLPIRPPVLCAGCPHRASFYAVKRAGMLQKEKVIFTGDIGCYTLGNAKPLDMVDTCLCMGAGITIAQGLKRAEPEAKQIAFIGDSTFFHTGISGIVNAVYNQTDLTVVVLDNSTTAMTGHQPHPGTGKTMMQEISNKISIEQVIRGCGVTQVYKANPFALEESIKIVNEAVNQSGVSVIIFEAPCIKLIKKITHRCVNNNCIKCQKCLKHLGCPAMSMIDGEIVIDEGLCMNCGLCQTVCPKNAIEEVSVCH
ncbi:MAG: indolepyruvate ferredoxin oxidoreductase subunit alpha [Cellulosilyticaceae bacterium]